MAIAKAEPNLAELLSALQSPTRAKMHSRKFRTADGRKVRAAALHPDKVSEELRHIFGHAEANGSSEGLLVSSAFSDIYMAALALLLAEEQKGLAPVTNSSADHGSAILSLLADSPSVVEPQQGMLISLTMKNLRIDPSTKIEDVIRFRQKRSYQLAELAAKLEDLNAKIKQTEDLKELEQQAQRIYERDVEKALDDLASELRAVSIQSAWEGVYRGVLFTVPAQSLLNVAGQALHTGPGAISSGVMIGAGALLTLTDVAVKTYFARRKTRKSSPFTYLLDAQRKFSVPSESSALGILQEYEQGLCEQ